MLEAQERLNHLNRSGKRLSKSQRRIWAAMVKEESRATELSAAKLAALADVSESTVVRFAVALGYDGYAQMQKALQELLWHQLTAQDRVGLTADGTPTDTLRRVLKSDMQNLRGTLDALDPAVFDEAVRRLLTARRIYVVGLRSAAPLAQFFGHYLNFLTDEVRLIAGNAVDVFESISRIGPEDVLFGISFPRYSTRTVEAMRYAHAQGAQVIGLTDGKLSPLGKLSDTCLFAQIDMASFVDSLAAPLSVINALLVAMGQERKDELTRHFNRLERLWDTYDIYLEPEDDDA